MSWIAPRSNVLIAERSATIRQEMLQTVEHLLRKVRRDQDVLDELQQVRDLLDSLPLASDDYSTATNRLRNAHRYLVSQERGAASYELQMLAGTLRQDEARGRGGIALDSKPIATRND